MGLNMQRRDFLKILSTTPILATLPSELLANSSSTKLTKIFSTTKQPHLVLKGLSPDFSDQLKCVEGLEWKKLISAGAPLGKGLSFGENNDYLQLFPLSKDRFLLWVNHEYFHPYLSSELERSEKNVNYEATLVGGSFIEIQKKNSQWEVVKDSPLHHRIDGNTPIPFAWYEAIAGSTSAIGTLGNCAGGKTPWGTVLTCEENYDMFYGERDRKTGKRSPSTYFGWEKVRDFPPEHYGWVVEINPVTHQAKKLVALGRFAHEAATIKVARNGRVVVYMGDDANDEFIYKFIADKKDSLEKGTLYVADTEKGKWIPLTREHPKLKTTFQSQTEILIFCREAARLVGATPQDRPEDVEIDPLNGDVVIACTNNRPAGRYFGKIIRLKEKDNNPLSMKFKVETFLSGGPQGGFACPDNIAFDHKGNLWFTTDMSGKDMHKDELNNFGNNGLFFVARTGSLKGIPIQLASAPIDAEFTGPLFSEDWKTLFLCVQHPGEYSQSKKQLSSRWPDGDFPRSSVITLQGPLLDKILQGS
jgi:secreted PhoX family phosphatase